VLSSLLYYASRTRDGVCRSSDWRTRRHNPLTVRPHSPVPVIAPNSGVGIGRALPGPRPRVVVDPMLLPVLNRRARWADQPAAAVHLRLLPPLIVH